MLQSPFGALVERLALEPGFAGAQLVGSAPLTGGFWAETTRLDLTVAGTPRAVVVRRMPDRGAATKEAAIQRAVAATGFAAPAVFLFDADGTEGSGGRAEVVMSLAQGAPMLSGLSGFAALAKLPSLARRLPALLADAMAALHAVDTTPVAAALARVDLTSAATLGAMLAGFVERTAAADRPDLADAMTRLAAAEPAAGEVVVCHGDLHPFNLLVTDDGTWTLLDWTASLLADPAYDVAFTRLMLRHPPLSMPAPLAPVVSAAGRWLAKRFEIAYAEASGRRLDPVRVDWFDALLSARMLLEVDGWRQTNTVADHPGHPFLTIGPHAAATLTRQTGVPVAWRLT